MIFLNFCYYCDLLLCFLILHVAISVRKQAAIISMSAKKPLLEQKEFSGKIPCDTYANINYSLQVSRQISIWSLVFQIREKEMDDFFVQKLTLSTTSRTSPSSQSFYKHYLSAPFMYYPSYNYLYIYDIYCIWLADKKHYGSSSKSNEM